MQKVREFSGASVEGFIKLVVLCSGSCGETLEGLKEGFTEVLRRVHASGNHRHGLFLDADHTMEGWGGGEGGRGSGKVGGSENCSSRVTRGNEEKKGRKVGDLKTNFGG